MEGELVDIQAEQGYYPPRLEFNIRLKNTEDRIWHIFAYKGIIKLEPNIYLGTDIDFETFEIAPNEERNLRPIFELDYNKLDLIEENRRGNLNLKLELDLLGVFCKREGDGTFNNLQAAMAGGLKRAERINVHSPNRRGEIVIPQSTWIETLERLDYGKFKIIEMVIPTTPSFSGLQDSIQRLQEAQQLLNKGENEEVITKCRKAFESLRPLITASSPQLATQIDLGSKGKPGDPDKSKRIEDIQQKIWKLLHIGPHEGYMVTRQDAELIIFLCMSMIRFYSVQFKKMSVTP